MEEKITEKSGFLQKNFLKLLLKEVNQNNERKGK